MPDPRKVLTTIRRATDLMRATPGRSGGIIAIEKAGTAAGGVDNVMSFWSGDMGGGEADFFGDVFEGRDWREVAAICLGVCSASLCNWRWDGNRLRAWGLGGNKLRSHQGKNEKEDPGKPGFQGITGHGFILAHQNFTSEDEKRFR